VTGRHRQGRRDQPSGGGLAGEGDLRCPGAEQDAVKTAELPETKAAFERWSSLLNGEPTFHNLDVVEQVDAT
jgi:hypothetical protein